MNKVCFICPIYPKGKHFEFGMGLLKSKIENNIAEELFYVFSNEEQKDIFCNRAKEELNYDVQYIIVPEEINSYKSVVVAKKLYALQFLMNKFDYVALIDCESKFIRYEDYSTLFKKIDDQQLCLQCNVSYDGFFIMRSGFKSMGLYNNKTLRKETCYFKYNNWFNEIQVYNCKKLPAFFDWLKKFDKNLYLNEWCCFEYYMYMAYLILEENYHIKRFNDIKSMGGVMEYIAAFDNKKQQKILKKLNTHWSSDTNAINNNTSILFHLDRKKNNYYTSHLKRLKFSIKRIACFILKK